MHDPRTLLGLGDEAVAQLARRRYRLDLVALRELVRRRREVTDASVKLRGEANRLAKEGGRDPAARARAQEVKEQVRQLEGQLRQVEDEVSELLLAIPNIADSDVPDGDSEEFAVEISRSGEPRVLPFQARHHADIGESTGILDLARASKLSGARFSVTRGAGAALERALAAFFLDLHVREHGYVEYSVPSLVTRQTMTGTGQLPKFADDLFRTEVGGRELFLIPTAEVPLTNLFAGELLDAADLPLAVTAYTHCFRAEAGSYGRDTRGILRLHEFGKVELVRLCRPEESRNELAILLDHAEQCLIRLGLSHRVVLLPAGDMGFSARATYDIEVWLPGQGRYREISSCSDCGTFQARRAKIRMRDRDGSKSPVATLNGSGLPVGRTLMAIMEQYQRADGGVDIPEALWPYTGFQSIDPNGTTH